MFTPYIYLRSLLVCIICIGLHSCQQTKLTHYFKTRNNLLCWWKNDLLAIDVIDSLWHTTKHDTALFWQYFYNKRHRSDYRIMASQVLEVHTNFWEQVDTAQFIELYFDAFNHNTIRRAHLWGGLFFPDKSHYYLGQDIQRMGYYAVPYLYQLLDNYNVLPFLCGSESDYRVLDGIFQYRYRDYGINLLSEITNIPFPHYPSQQERDSAIVFFLPLLHAHLDSLHIPYTTKQ